MGCPSACPLNCNQLVVLHPCVLVLQRVYTGSPMTRSRYNFWIDDEQREGIRQIKERDGVLESEQIRRAINRWLQEKGVKLKSAKPVRAKRTGEA